MFRGQQLRSRNPATTGRNALRLSNAPNPHHVTVSSVGSKFISWEFVLDPKLVVLSMLRSATISLRTKCEGIRKRWARGTRREHTARGPGADQFTGNPGPPLPLGDGITSPVWKPPARKAEQSPGIHPSGRGCYWLRMVAEPVSHRGQWSSQQWEHRTGAWVCFPQAVTVAKAFISCVRWLPRVILVTACHLIALMAMTSSLWNCHSVLLSWWSHPPRTQNYYLILLSPLKSHKEILALEPHSR